ncbi:MAG: ATP-binding protein [Synechococcus sp.]
MSTDVVCAPATTTVQSLAQLMTERSVSCVVLVESRKDSRPAEGDAPLLIPIGIVTERDIIQFQALGLNFARTPADAVMSAPLFLMQPQNSLWSAYQQMQQRHVRRVVIAGDRGELVGIVTQTNILSALDPAKMLGEIGQLQHFLDIQTVELGQTNQHLQQEIVERERLEAALREANRTLEAEVELKTAELRQTNQALRKEISDRQLVEEELYSQSQQARLLAEITLKFRHSLKLEDSLETAVTELKQFLRADRVLIFRLRPDGSGTVLREAVEPGWPVILGQDLFDPCFQEGYVDQYRQGRVSAIADLEQADLQPCHVKFLQQFGVKANLVVPILLQSDLWGLLIAHQCARPRQWTRDETELLHQLADQIGISLSQAQLLENLEAVVEKRTSELTETNRRLKQEIEERKLAEEAFSRSERKFRAIFDQTFQFIGLLEPDGTLLETNRSFLDFGGLTFADVLGKPFWNARWWTISTATQDRLKEAIARAAGGQFVRYEVDIVGVGDRVITLDFSLKPVKDETGQVILIIPEGRDISDRKVIDRMKDEFIATISHELRTPLTSIHGSLKLLATGELGTLSEDGEEMLAVADENCDRLVRLIGDLLDFQRLESGKVALRKQIQDAGEAIVKAAEAMQGMAQQKEIRLETAPVFLPIWADPDYVMQILTNLISNAIKFSPRGSTVWIEVRARSNETLFAVRDRGEGIPGELLETIFERFQQLDSTTTRQKGGTGLGLAICRSIVNQHGGRIWAESTLGRGSTFYFTLPTGAPTT